MTEYHLDYETASEADLEIVGLANYMSHPSTRVLMACYAEGDHRVKCWEPHLNPKIPNELHDALTDPFVSVKAWGVSFERQATKRLLRIDKPREEWRCVMVKSRYLSLPGSLEDAGKILGLKESEAKIEDGKRLIKKFCSAESLGGEETLYGLSTATFRDWSTDPEDWEKFKEYCARDVVAERTIEKKLNKFPLPEHEWATWALGEKVNETGWCVDMALVTGAKFVVEKELERLNARLLEITNLSNPNSPAQLQPWLQERGYCFSSIDKNFSARALNGECNLAPEAREVLLLRGQTAKSSVRKYTNIADMVSADGRLRHQYTFMGAARTGRWAAHGVNVGNLPKPEKAVEKKMQRAIELVRSADYDGIRLEFEKPLDVVSSTVRASFRAPEGKKLVVADLASIENLGASFIARCESGLQVFRDDRDPYLDFAMHFYHQPYEELAAEYDEGRGNKTKRTMCKPATLGSGFGLGPGKEVIDAETGEKTWEGLLGYARAMNVVMTLEEATKAIQVFRSVYPEIPRCWKDLERAAKRAVKNPGQLVGAGVPHTQREKDWFEEQDRKIYDPIISFLCHGTKVLELRLPSGRSLHYIDPQVEEEKYTWKGKELVGEKLSYYGKEQNSVHWGRVPTHGGKIFENADQAWARDILVNGMHEADRAGFEIMGSTYDELITLVDEGSPLGLTQLCACMTKKPHWMPEGIPLKAAGYEAKEYRKD